MINLQSWKLKAGSYLYLQDNSQQVANIINIDIKYILRQYQQYYTIFNYIYYLTKKLRLKMSEDCTICCDEAKLFGITECNHGPFCFRCIYKMRVLDKNNCCPICKMPTAQVMISPLFDKFGAYKGQVLPDSNFGDVFHCGKQAKKQFQKLKQVKCFVRVNGNPCKNDKLFDNIAFLKKHLKQQHKRVLCDVCLEKKTCTLEQQKLYTQAQLNRHLERGDIDQLGNVIFLHPYCGFCRNYFFDEDSFKRHMGLQHMTCNVCANQYKYTYYKNYDSLQTHYKISHYICSDVNCLAKKFIAFKSAQQLKVHRNQYHSIGKKIDGKQLCGFNYGGVIMDQVIQIKDKEGIDMQDQFLTLKKSKNNAIGQVDQQQDLPIDMRDFYHTQMDQQQHFNQSFILKHHKNDKNQKVEQEKPQQKTGKKKKYIQREQFQKQKPTFAKQNQQFMIEQLNLTRSLHLTKLHYQDFENKLSTLLTNDELKKIETNRNKFNKRQINAHNFLEDFYSIMKKVSLRAAYQIFPHYIRTVQNQDAKYELNLQYIKSLKRIPIQTKNMISQCKTYGQLFKRLLKQIETNLQTRIKDSSLSIKKPILREKQRLFQIIGVLRRLKTQQMAKFKFAVNFGVQLDTSHMIHQKVFKLNVQNTQNRLSKIPNDQFIDLYVFVKYCYEAITHNQNMHLAKNKIHQNVLEEFLFERPQLEKQYGVKKQDLKTLQQKVQYQKQLQQKNEKKKLRDIDKKNKDLGYHSKANFSLNDKGDFPELMEQKKQGPKIKQDFRQFVETAKSKPATYQKKINELFPSLGQKTKTEPQQQQKKQQRAVKKQKAWWQKINEPRHLQQQQGEEVVKIRKGKNKKQKWVSGKGFFGH